MFFSFNFAASSSLIGREASEKSVSPLMNFSNPPPVPDTPTDTCTFGCTAEYSSTIASMIGATVEDPSPEILPSSFSFSPACASV